VAHTTWTAHFRTSQSGVAPRRTMPLSQLKSLYRAHQCTSIVVPPTPLRCPVLMGQSYLESLHYPNAAEHRFLASPKCCTTTVEAADESFASSLQDRSGSPTLFGDGKSSSRPRMIAGRQQVSQFAASRGCSGIVANGCAYTFATS
jgi:hypothetical protein